jgi:hypothetical protein
MRPAPPDEGAEQPGEQGARERSERHDQVQCLHVLVVVLAG